MRNGRRQAVASRPGERPCKREVKSKKDEVRSGE
jgi:hypothetical protein